MNYNNLPSCFVIDNCSKKDNLKIKTFFKELYNNNPSFRLFNIGGGEVHFSDVTGSTSYYEINFIKNTIYCLNSSCVSTLLTIDKVLEICASDDILPEFKVHKLPDKYVIENKENNYPFNKKILNTIDKSKNGWSGESKYYVVDNTKNIRHTRMLIGTEKEIPKFTFEEVDAILNNKQTINQTIKNQDYELQLQREPTETTSSSRVGNVIELSGRETITVETRPTRNAKVFDFL